MTRSISLHSPTMVSQSQEMMSWEWARLFRRLSSIWMVCSVCRRDCIRVRRTNFFVAGNDLPLVRDLQAVDQFEVLVPSLAFLQEGLGLLQPALGKILLPTVALALQFDEPSRPHLQERYHSEKPHPNRGLLQIAHGDDATHGPQDPHEQPRRVGQPQHHVSQWSRFRDRRDSMD